MCGRFTLRTPLTVLSQQFLFELGELPAETQVAPRYNVAPTQTVAAVRVARAGRGSWRCSVGADSVVGEGCEDRVELDQCTGRDGGGEAGVSDGVCAAAMFDPGGWVL